MNKFTGIFISLLTLLMFSLCSTTKEATKIEPPFKVIKATHNSWVGGRPGVKGININITIDNSKIELDSVFFRNKKTKLKKDISISPSIFIGVFINKNIKKDYTLHEDPVKEYGNTPPDITIKMPFELQTNEAIVSYLHKGKIQYYKIEDVVKTKDVIMY